MEGNCFGVMYTCTSNSWEGKEIFLGAPAEFKAGFGVLIEKGCCSEGVDGGFWVWVAAHCGFHMSLS